MFNLISVIRAAREAYEAAVAMRGAVVCGGSTDLHRAKLETAFRHLGAALGYAIDIRQVEP